MRKKITTAELDKLPANAIIHDKEVKGFVARKLASGSVSLGFRYRAGGRPHWYSLGILGVEIALDEARTQAKVEAGKVAGGGNPAIELAAEKAAKVADAETVVSRLAMTFLQHYAKTVRPKTHYDAERVFSRFIVPTFGKMQIGEIKRSDVVRLLDKIEADSMSNQVLATLSNFFNWHARRSDDFVSVIVRGMARGERTMRERVLADDEIADLWAVLDDPDSTTPAHFGDHLKFVLLTGQRPGECGSIEAHEIEGSIWKMPARKNKNAFEHWVPLSAPALAVLAKYMHDEYRTGSYLFSSRGKGPAPVDNKLMHKLRKAVNERRKREGRKPMENWTRHDLRRTARTLLSRLGVDFHTAERVIGHSVGSKVSRTYDKHNYFEAKRDALERLAALVATITNPPSGGKVVPLRKSAAV